MHLTYMHLCFTSYDSVSTNKKGQLSLVIQQLFVSYMSGC